ncbi:MAG: fucose isomerase [Anaerolineae bacterium]|jgi:L-fucose isomerase-like protein|nr:fucose isomerase [Anaerolineae bacterium]
MPPSPLLGLCPIGKFVFSNEDAIRVKCTLQEKLHLWQVPYIDLEGVLEDGLVRDQTHVDTAVAHFRKAGATALFMPHCNFGTEGAVGMIAKKLGVPVLLWGPRDEAPLDDGTRLRDTLCGLFASSKVLSKLSVPFTYIENCRLDDPKLRQGIDTYVRAAHIAGALRSGMRIGLIGQRIDFFWSTIVNESELLQKFAVEVLPFDMVEFIAASRQRAKARQEHYAKEVAELRRAYRIEGLENAALMNVLAVRDQILDLAADHGLEAIAFQTFMSVVDAMGAYCIHAEGEVAEHYAFALESDIHGAISGALLRRAALGRDPVWLAEFTSRHPTDDNAALLWHAGAPLSMRHPDAEVRIGHHWILPSPLSGMTHFRLKDGPITVARFDGDTGDYRLAVGEGHSTDGPATQNNYVWMQVDDWPHWERTIIEGPFPHHLAMTYGAYSDALIEACRFVPGLAPVRLNR